MKNILVVFGGKSYEHDISVVTAMQIYKKSRLKDERLFLLYVSRDERFFLCDDKNLKIIDFAKNKFSSKNKNFKEVFFVSGEKQKLFVKTHFGLKQYLECGTAIFACHGGDGENGKLISFFNKQGIACSAGSCEALAICMDKMMFKMVAKGAKIPVVDGFKISKFEYFENREQVEAKLSKFKFPLILKANSGGSSIGLFIAKTVDEFDEKIKQLFEFGDDVLVEKYIENAREFNIAILGDEYGFEVSEIDEPIKENDVLTFADKYLKNDGKSGKGNKNSMASSSRKFPADIDELLVEKIKKIAKNIFVSLGLFGIVRIDFLFDEKNNKIYVCEVNAIPGSLAFYFFKKNKIVTNDLIEKLVQIAERNFENNNINERFVVDVLNP